MRLACRSFFEEKSDGFYTEADGLAVAADVVEQALGIREKSNAL